MVLHLQNVEPVYLEKEKIARSQIWKNDIRLSKGEWVQIVAPSGSGKTSLIHFLYGLRKDYSGEIFLDNQQLKNISAENLSIFRSKNASIIFQDLRLFPDHTAQQNIEIKKTLVPFESKYSILQMAEQLGIAEKLEQKSQLCSHGERQRIAIIRALQQPFDFLLADEPFSHLDHDNAAKAMQLIKEEALHRGAGIILADLQPLEHFKEHRTFQL